MHTHTCKHCGDQWDGGDTPLQVGEDTWECQCRSTDTCEGCTPELYRPLCVQCDEMGDYALGVAEVEGPYGRQWACARHYDEAGERGATMWSTEDGIERDATDGTHAERVKPPRRVVAAEPASRKEANGA